MRKQTAQKHIREATHIDDAILCNQHWIWFWESDQVVRIIYNNIWDDAACNILDSFTLLCTLKRVFGDYFKQTIAHYLHTDGEGENERRILFTQIAIYRWTDVLCDNNPFDKLCLDD